MAYRDISIVNIALQTAGVTAQGFGTPLFASSHRYFPERVRSYTSLTAAAEDLPTNSNAYKAVQAFFSNSPSPSVVKIARREADLDLTVAVTSTSGSLTVFANDGTNTYSVAVNVTGQVDENAVATAIAAAIEGDANVGPLVVASAATNVVSIDVAAPTYTFWVANLSNNLSETYNTTETAPDLISAIEAEDTDWYFFTADDHSETFVLAASDDIEARRKVYFVSTAQQSTLTPYVEGAATDILGKLADSGNTRTAGLFHHEADTVFPECTYCAYNAPFDAGATTWTNLVISLSVAKDPATGKVLSATQKGYIQDRYAAYVESIGGNNILRGGRTASNTPIDFIHGRDNLEEDLEVAFTNLLINQKGGKLPYTNASINVLSNTLSNVLSRYVARNFINQGFEKFINFPGVEDVPVADKQAGVYRSGTFKAELAGTIENVGPITGTLALQLS